MVDRLIPTQMFRAHWKALSDYRAPGKPRPDIFTRAVLIGVPTAVVILCLVAKFELKAPEGLLAGLALLAGGLLGAFTHLSSTRVQLAEREHVWGEAERVDRDSIDETSAHLLVASYLAGVAAAVLVLGMNFGATPTGAIAGVWAAAAGGLMSYVLLLFLIALPRLYSAYALHSNVRAELSGSHRD